LLLSGVPACLSASQSNRRPSWSAPWAKGKSIANFLQLRPQEKVSALIRVKEFTDKGYGGARIDSIARRSGANKRMIYHYFGDKDGLYLAVLFLFRFRHPPLLIPWSDIKVRRRKGWIFEYVTLTMGREIEIPLKIRKSLAAKLRAAAGASWPVEET